MRVNITQQFFMNTAGIPCGPDPLFILSVEIYSFTPSRVILISEMPGIKSSISSKEIKSGLIA